MASVIMEDASANESQQDTSDIELLSTEDWEESSQGCVADEELSEEAPSEDIQDGEVVIKAKDAGTAYRVLNSEQLADMQSGATLSLVNLIQCSTQAAKVILIHYRWDLEKVQSVLAELGFSELYNIVGIPLLPATTSSGAPNPQGQGDASAVMMCEICCSEVNRETETCAAALCDHIFCNDCWRQHFVSGIQEGKACLLRCMAYKCNAAADEACVQHLLAGLPELAQFEERMLLSYVGDNSSACFCPSTPWCGNSIVAEGEHNFEPKCECGQEFCFKCKKEPHSPCTCSMWDAWEEKTTGDSETRNWISANTKPCPKCSKAVEKNGGCNLVRCKCGQYFCWLCGEGTGSRHTYQSIEGHTCGRYKEELDKKIDDAAQQHKRYMHYFARWKGHTDSLKLETCKRYSHLAQCTGLIVNSTHESDFGWLTTGLDQLRVGRGVLSKSYVFGFFFFGQQMYKDDFSAEENLKNQNLFEDQQTQLELEVERLSSLANDCYVMLAPTIPHPLAVEIGEGSTRVKPELRLTFINSTANIKQRITKLYGAVQDLLDKLQTRTEEIAVCRVGG